MAELAQTIAHDIQQALDADDLHLPSLPEVALRIRDEAESEHVTSASLASVVQDDPALAAQLVRVANSPLFRAAQPIDDLAHAISRLGVEHAANMVTGLAMQHMFQATSDLIDRKMRQVWKSATDVAAWCSILSKRYTKLRPDQATLAGLTHSIGALPILGWAEENDGLIRDSMTLDRVIETLHPVLGTMILKSWNFPEEITAVPEQFTQYERSIPAADYVDIVACSHLLSLRDTDHPVTQDDWGKVAAFSRVGIDLDPDSPDFEETVEAVEAIKGVFS
jgi:HD-like signal output (HDOD) protein